MLKTLYKNAMLDGLSAEAVLRLKLLPMRFELGHEMEFPGGRIAHLYFVEEGMASMTATFTDGSQVGVGTFGIESAIGVSALMGSRRSLNGVYTQIAGSGYSTTLALAQVEFGLGGEFQRLMLGSAQAQLAQATQLAGCNARHELEQRLARLLLVCGDRTNGSRFSISHESLANMLGVTRPTVTLAAVHLKALGVIGYARGRVVIRDAAGLEEASCECYRTVKEHLEHSGEFDAEECLRTAAG